VTIEEMIVQIEVERNMAVNDRDRALAEIKAIIARSSSDGQSSLTKDETARTEELFATVERKKADIIGINSKLEQAVRAQGEEQKVEQLQREKGEGGAETRVAYDHVARVGSEERTYHTGNDRGGSQFVRDVSRQFLYRDLQAETRLTRHMQEERVERAQYLQRAAGDANTGAFTGLVVPQYLTDMYAPATANLRPFADICNKHTLPSSGMTVNISRITTATSVALQAAELAGVSATSIDDTLLTENVQTAAGQQTLSRQAIERGTGVEEVVMGDLFRRYATTLDSTLINQATTGLAAVSQVNTYTDTSPTAAELYPKLHQAAAGVEAALLGQAVPSHVIMHSRRWYWLQSQVGSSWPFMSQPGIDTQAGGKNLATPYGSGARGILPNGMLAVVDNNIATNSGAGTNEDGVFVVPADECHLWEDPQAPVFIRAEQAAAAQLGVLLVLYGYFAYSFRRYTNATQLISGTGLVTPSF
jgi:HK97 family phage major capsid protein